MNSTNYSIIVPISFSAQSMIALEQAERLAVLTHGEITLLSVIESSGLLSRLFGENDVRYKDFKLDLQGRLDKMASEVSSRTGLRVNAMAAKGKVYRKIVEVSEQIRADLIVMGLNGAPLEFSKKIIGSNAFRVVTSAKCPVITIKGKNHFKGCRNIILPLDLNKETKQKVSHALTFARLWGATVKVVSVVEGNDMDALAKLNANLNQVKNYLIDGGVKTTIELVKTEGRSLSKVILDYSNENEADLIMIMTQQENDFTTHFIGSAAQSILYNSDVPVMSVCPVLKISEVYDLP